ncbi:hypothetical protein HYD90_03450 [Mycoplasmopsis bovis]|nr:hypothetical protein [Mycoplasmopsis bovis]QQH35994.1 hypothetical protein HYD90_03450 [Mycoplasmopsis bovis]
MLKNNNVISREPTVTPKDQSDESRSIKLAKMYSCWMTGFNELTNNTSRNVPKND